MPGRACKGIQADMDDREFRKALQRAAREQGLDPTEVLAGWDVEKGLPHELGELLARVLREMADPNQDQNPDQNG